MVTAYLSIGSNIGDRRNNLERMTGILGGIKGIRITGASSLYETEPVGGVRQRKYFNAVLRIDTALSPLELLSVCNSVERALGRKRLKKYGPRTADIDILLYGSLRMKSRKLTLPHREMAKRRFVLVPLNEVNPRAGIPGAKSAARMLKELKDQKSVTKAGEK